MLNILGTNYEFCTKSEREDPLLDDGVCGYCDGYAKTITVREDYNENQSYAIQNFNSLINISKRHEIIHAMLFESGLPEMAEDELLVGWIAWQFPKMAKLFAEVEASE